MQSIAGPVHASVVLTDEKTTTTKKKKKKKKKQKKKKKKKKHQTVPVGYSLFADHRSVPSFGPGFVCLKSRLTLPKQSLCTNFAITR